MLFCLNTTDVLSLTHIPITILILYIMNSKVKSIQKPSTPQLITQRSHCQFGRLAMLYYPDRGYKRAVRLFRDEIKITGGLLEALKELGYHDRQRMLTARQVRIIEDLLGEAG